MANKIFNSTELVVCVVVLFKIEFCESFLFFLIFFCIQLPVSQFSFLI